MSLYIMSEKCKMSKGHKYIPSPTTTNGHKYKARNKLINWEPINTYQEIETSRKS